MVILSAGIWLDHLMEFIAITGPRDTRWIIRNSLLLAVLCLLILTGIFVVANNRAKNQQLDASQNELGAKFNFLKDQLNGMSQNGRHYIQEHQRFTSLLATNLAVGPETRAAMLDDETNLQTLYASITNLNDWMTRCDAGRSAAHY